MSDAYLHDALFTFRWYKDLAERAMAQLDDDQFHWTADDESNSVAILVKHMAGNMRSRWRDFLETDGEKPDRDRDDEFVDTLSDRAAILQAWDIGWRCVFEALEPLSGEDVTRVVTIRGREHTVLQAIQRQLTHYAYHVGQIAYLARTLVGKERWKTLSIARGKSDEYTPRGRL